MMKSTTRNMMTNLQVTMVTLMIVMLPLPTHIYAENGFSFAVSQNISSFNLLGVDQPAQLGVRLGYRYKTYQPYVLLDYHNTNFRVYQQNEECQADTMMLCQTEWVQDIKLSTWMLGVGLKKLFSPVKQEQVNMYVLSHLYIAMPQITINEILNTHNNMSFGLTASFGAQYCFTKNFTVGAELGLHYVQGIQANASVEGAGSQTQLLELSGTKVEAQNIQVLSRVILEFVL